MQSLNYKTFCDLWDQLNQLLENNNDNEEADAIRDRMDYYWKGMTEEEITTFHNRLFHDEKTTSE